MCDVDKSLNIKIVRQIKGPNVKHTESKHINLPLAAQLSRHGRILSWVRLLDSEKFLKC